MMAWNLPRPPMVGRREPDAALAVLMDRLFEPIAPGVEGFTRDDGVTLEIGGIRAYHEGSGDVGRFLDQLPIDRPVLVPFVTNPRLDGMLERRGFTRPDRVWHRVLGWVPGDGSWQRDPIRPETRTWHITGPRPQATVWPEILSQHAATVHKLATERMDRALHPVVAATDPAYRHLLRQNDPPATFYVKPDAVALRSNDMTFVMEQDFPTLWCDLPADHPARGGR